MLCRVPRVVRPGVSKGAISGCLQVLVGRDNEPVSGRTLTDRPGKGRDP